MAVVAGVPPAKPDSLWSTLEDQRGDVPLLSSAWSLPGEEEWQAKKRFLGRACSALAAGATEIWAFVRADRRRPVFAAKVGLALAIISLLIFLHEPEEIVSHSIWAILTVIFIFEFSIGATLNKCFNRGLGTLTAGGLALAVAVLSKNLGKMEDMILITSIFTVGFCTNLAKLHPKMKPYDYGFRIFLVTYVIVMVSGYNTRKITDKVVSRFLLIALGTALTVGINICIYPIWSGEDLHNSVAKNFAGVAKSLEGCVDEYLKCVDYEKIPSRLHTYQTSDDRLYSGYREAVEASVKEETLLGFAIWEPPHGPYRMMGYPWKSFTKVGGALRHCYFAVMALHGCIHSEIQLYKRSVSGVFQRCVEPTEGIELLREIHQGECGHHASSRAIVGKAFRHGFYWPTALKDAEEMVKTCNGCQRFAKKRHAPASALKTIPITWPFAVWGLDMVGPFRTARGGMTHLLVMIDKFTKWIEAKPIKKLDGSTAVTFLKEIIVRYGYPHSIITDNGTNFAQGVFSRFCEEKGIQMDLASVHTLSPMGRWKRPMA
ncbi:hypothetical protein QYE76_019278 [Lolium multiflorum]|uniref:Integrase catalytic domain-containing protein n=1 Tax=Lolium multiflorum TaxID=4521 RepID=A0AAD8VQA7_LOLMU|nr:hypothetical protein QYE76_019278 [Lolium multiflorum]